MGPKQFINLKGKNIRTEKRQTDKQINSLADRPKRKEHLDRLNERKKRGEKDITHSEIIGQ